MPNKIRVPGRKSPQKRKPFKKDGEIASAHDANPAPPLDPTLAEEPHQFDNKGLKFVLNPPPPREPSQPPAYEYLGELPDSYGTKKLYLVARDPYYVFAYWDLSWQQYQEACHHAHDGKVFLQIYNSQGHRLQQIQIYEGFKNWYIQVNQPDTTFYAELGTYRQDGHFEVIARSGDAKTPRDNVSWNTNARFVTIPYNYTFRQLYELIAGHILDGEDLAEALARLQESGFPFPFMVGRGRGLSDEQQQRLMEYIGGDIIKRMQVGSMEITEILRRRFDEMRSSGQWLSSMTSPFGASFGAQPRDFFMHVNAELIIYGGTHPQAKVKVDGKDIQLRPDGTFSYHFVLPDGRYHIPIDATAPDGLETRSAMLSFLRMSDYSGDVQKTPQPPLPPPIGKRG